MICDIPQPCIEVIYAGYEAGEGRAVSNHVKLTCRTKDGVSTFIEWQLNGWGLLGLNRATAPSQIDFRTGGSPSLKCR